MYNYNQIPMNYRYSNDRFVGGFLGPFILGGITGGLAAPLFYNNGGCNRPNCYNNYYYPYPIYYPTYYR